MKRKLHESTGILVIFRNAGRFGFHVTIHR